MLVIGFGRRKVKRGVAHTAPVKELAARSIVNKLSAKKIAADTYRSLREDWYAAIFTRGLVKLSAVFLSFFYSFYCYFFYPSPFFFLELRTLKLLALRLAVCCEKKRIESNSALRVVCRRTRGAAADIPTILNANASFCCIWGGTQRRFQVRQRHTRAHTRQRQHATAASRVRSVEMFALICMNLCML